jgi:hypothetical protein
VIVVVGLADQLVIIGINGKQTRTSGTARNLKNHPAIIIIKRGEYKQGINVGIPFSEFRSLENASRAGCRSNNESGVLTMLRSVLVRNGRLVASRTKRLVD